MNEKRRACAHINSSVRRGQQAVPAKMPRIAADILWMSAMGRARSVTGNVYAMVYA